MNLSIIYYICRSNFNHNLIVNLPCNLLFYVIFFLYIPWQLITDCILENVYFILCRLYMYSAWALNCLSLYSILLINSGKSRNFSALRLYHVTMNVSSVRKQYKFCPTTLVWSFCKHVDLMHLYCWCFDVCKELTSYIVGLMSGNNLKMYVLNMYQSYEITIFKGDLIVRSQGTCICFTL